MKLQDASFAGTFLTYKNIKKWDNFKIIPQIYKCEVFVDPFKFVNKM